MVASTRKKNEKERVFKSKSMYVEGLTFCQNPAMISAIRAERFANAASK